MASKKKHSKKHTGKKVHGFEGFEGKRKKHVKHHVSHVISGGGFDAGGIGLDLAGILAGGIGLSFLAGLIPVKNPKMKAAIPILAGIAGLAFPQISGNRFLNRAALGGLAVGGYSLTKQLAPALPLMGAADTAEGIGYAIQALPPEEKAVLGLLEDYSGEGAEPAIYEGNQPGEMLGSDPGEMLGATEMIEGEPGEMLGITESIGADSDFE